MCFFGPNYTIHREFHNCTLLITRVSMMATDFKSNIIIHVCFCMRVLVIIEND